MKRIKVPVILVVERDDATISAELARRGLHNEFTRMVASGPYCVLVLPHGDDTDIFIATYVDSKDSGLIWYRFVGNKADHPLVQRLIGHFKTTGGPACLARIFPGSKANTPPGHPEGRKA
jgi:hypothetical protein